MAIAKTMAISQWRLRWPKTMNATSSDDTINIIIMIFVLITIVINTHTNIVVASTKMSGSSHPVLLGQLSLRDCDDMCASSNGANFTTEGELYSCRCGCSAGDSKVMKMK
jgi:hypothetical protein